ncbi:MAG: YifB family Mg chelatase-like AAA ATPase [Lachnospiraceae bacterium]|nr:YifB family Mg chelatase-like AAA ATPase [Lachnospiraceae bacterium]
MFTSVASAALVGIEAREVLIEVDISDGGMPVLEMVGFLGSEVRESKERIRTALKNSGYILPPRRITINFSPADLRKSGTSFDLAVAVSVVSSMGNLPREYLEGTLVVGELSLSGEVKKTNGILPMVLMAKESGFKRIIVPKENEKEGAVANDIDVIGVENIEEAVGYLCRTVDLKPCKCMITEKLSGEDEFELDFSDIKGQEMAIRAVSLSVAGMHNLLLIGPPGSGKSMIAKRIPTIMPPMSERECLELTKIYSAAGKLGDRGLVTKRPFITAHHTSTPQSLTGGGRYPSPGLCSLSMYGTLFLDELPEFQKGTLEALREPLEDKCVTVARSGWSYTFPADMLLVTAANPCRCGYYPDKNRCKCTERDVRAYQGRISGPILDRIDITCRVEGMDFDELNDRGIKGESSEKIRERVINAVEMQKKRFEGKNIRFNSGMEAGDIRKYCVLGEKEEELLKQSFKKLGLSARGYHRILKCARTIADMDESDRISCAHLSEAISYRFNDINM